MPSLGVTKKVSVTLPQDLWEKIEGEIKDQDLKSMSAFFRKLALDRYKERV
jgi:metal-responsive CopG/Arc/MetJ family transcriptional regulator